VPNIDLTQDFEDSQLAFKRVESEIVEQSPNDLSPYNVELLSATSTVTGALSRVMAYRERASKLIEFDVKNFDKLPDYTKATFYLYVTNLPAPALDDEKALIDEANSLRAKFMMWAHPLAASGRLNPDAIAKIKDGTGNLNNAADLVALASLFRAHWDDVKNMCGVTEQDLDRASKVGPAVFALLSRRGFKAPALPEVALRVRQAFTLMDRAYDQCRRAIQFFQYDEGDADEIAPSLRRNAGPRKVAPQSTVDPQAPVSAPEDPAEPVVGSGGNPYNNP